MKVLLAAATLLALNIASTQSLAQQPAAGAASRPPPAQAGAQPLGAAAHSSIRSARRRPLGLRHSAPQNPCIGGRERSREPVGLRVPAERRRARSPSARAASPGSIRAGTLDPRAGSTGLPPIHAVSLDRRLARRGAAPEIRGQPSRSIFRTRSPARAEARRRPPSASRPLRRRRRAQGRRGRSSWRTRGSSGHQPRGRDGSFGSRVVFDRAGVSCT